MPIEMFENDTNVHCFDFISPETPVEHLIAGWFRVSLFIDLGCPSDLGTGWRGVFGTFMTNRLISQGSDGG